MGAVVHALGQPVQFGGRGTQGIGTITADIGYDLVIDVFNEPLEVFLDAGSRLVQALFPRAFWISRRCRVVDGHVHTSTPLIMRMRKTRGQWRL